MIELYLTEEEVHSLMRLAAVLNTDLEGVVERSLKMVILPHVDDFLKAAADHTAGGWVPGKNKN